MLWATNITNNLKLYKIHLSKKSLFDFIMDFSKLNDRDSPLKKIPRERIGMWGTGDNDIPGNISGLQRLQHKKHNKVSSLLCFFYSFSKVLFH